MDKVSKLLQEAKPLYQKKERERYALGGCLISFLLAVGLWAVQPVAIVFDEGAFDSYVAALYLNDSYYSEDVSDSVVPVDGLGLYEVI